MTTNSYDIVTIGGGLGGSSLAKAMAEHGARVLVVERETAFKDRIRGEQMSPWGIAEAQSLGIYQLLLDTCGHNLPWFNTYIGLEQLEHRDLVATTPQQVPMLAFHHPAMQEVLIQAAADAGAEVRRGAKVSKISKPSQAQPGTMPTVTIEQAGRLEEVHTRLVVGADGRNSGVRQWAGFHVQQDPDRRMLTGMLFEDMPGPLDDTNYLIINPDLGQIVAVFPQGEGRVRTYLGYEQEKHTRFQGAQDLSRFIEQSMKTGASPEWFTGMKSNGPLATFHGADTWVAHPYQAGVVLIGDAAASNDPSYGQGLSLTVRDVRVLRDQLLQHDNWETAGHAYAAEHDTYYTALHTVTRWFGQMLYESGPEADARRAHAFPLLVQDKTRIPDVIISGPEAGATETVRRRFFGEE